MVVVSVFLGVMVMMMMMMLLLLLLLLWPFALVGRSCTTQ
jgi:hypothetical protein